MFLQKLSENLTDSHFIPWRMRHLGGPLNTIVSIPLRRYKFINLIKKNYNDKPDDITVMICIKGRLDYRIENNLKSIRAQTYPQNLIKIIIVDYDNNKDDATKLQQLSKRYDVNLIRVDNRPIWNKSKAFNIAIKHVSTKFLMANDADMIISPNFLAETINSLKDNPFSLVLGAMLDLPEEMETTLKKYIKDDLDPDTELLREHTKLRKTYEQSNDDEIKHIAIYATYTFFLKKINGYDEFYEYWGWEDHDMYRRLCYLGLKTINIFDKAFYMHQWHEKFEGVKHDGLREIIETNRNYFYSNHSIVRNNCDWGKR